MGYYGSVLQVTGNTSYAKILASNYLSSGLDNIADIRPDLSPSFKIVDLDLRTNWYSNESYSSGDFTIEYDLGGLGVSGLTYSSSSQLDVQVLNSQDASQALLNVYGDGEPIVNLGKSNFKFYKYLFTNATWDLVSLSKEPITYVDGKYLVDLPSGMNMSFVIQVEDTRGLMVVASSFSQFTGTLAWNTTSVEEGFDFIDYASLNVTGTHSNFTAQQSVPDSVYDTLTEGALGYASNYYYPTYRNLGGSTTITQTSGNITADVCSSDNNYLGLHSYASALGSTGTFGYSTVGTSYNDFSYSRGSRFQTTTSGSAESISAYLSYTQSSGNLGNTASSGTSYSSSIENRVVGQRIQTPSSEIVVQSIIAYIGCTTATKNMKAAIYTNGGTLVASSNEISVDVGNSPRTFTFSSPQTLNPSTYYVIVVYSASGSGNALLYANSNSGGSGRYYGGSYGTWPSVGSWSTNSYNYRIYCTYTTSASAQCAIYSADGSSRLGTTEEVSLSPSTGSWVTFDFETEIVLSASTNYVLMVWCSDQSNVRLYYGGTATNQRYQGSGSYNSWPTIVTYQSSQRNYNIYCTYSQVTEYTAQIELIGTSDLLSWQQLTWLVESSVTSGSASLTLQLATSDGTYPTSGNDGYNTTTLTTSDTTKTLTITSNPTNFRNSTGYWKLMLNATSATSFDLKIDLAQFSPQLTNYALNLQEQFVDLNSSLPRQDLCIKAGTLGSESLLVQVFYDSSWRNLMSLSTGWNNISVSSYIDSSDLTIRFIGTTETGDPTQDTYQIDAVFLKPQPDIDYLINLQDSTFTVEYLQNGTLHWLGQNLQLATQELPIPPIPVKAIHVNATINGVNQEIPFQIEDWASDYQVPLGLTSNASVFSNNQMIVFLINNKVTDFTVWWDGSDSSVQTPLAYTNTYFKTDNPIVTPSKGILSNGILTLTVEVVSNVFKVTSENGGATSTTTFMRINGDDSTYGAGQASVIHHGIVRDVIAQEAEWGNGAPNSPNVYASIVLTLPANVSYYTYSLRMMYLESTQTRTLTDLCPLELSTTLSSIQAQTENGTIVGFPIVQNGTGVFSDYDSSANWTAHHWSQFITNDGSRGTGIMFTDSANLKLYAFDSIAGIPTGTISISSSTKTIELLPVDLASASFQYPLDITWSGAVATFDNTTPICGMYESSPTGLWILAEYPPTLTIVAQTS